MVRKLVKTFEYGNVPNSYDLLKAMALVTMVIDHIGNYLLPDYTWLRVVGRLAAPAFLFLVGYSDNFRFDKWLCIGATAVLLCAAFTGHPVFPLNILFAILFWRMLLGWLTRQQKTMQDIPILWVALLAFYVPSMILLDYGTVAMMFALLGWYTRHGRNDMAVRGAWLFTLAIWCSIQITGFQFDMWQGALVLLEGVLLVIYMMQFRLRQYPLPPNHASPSPTWLEAVVILVARNTLLLYVLHVFILMVAAKLLWPQLYADFVWLHLR